MLVLDDVHVAALARVPDRPRLPRPARAGHAAARARRARGPGAAAARPARARPAGRDPRRRPRVHRARGGGAARRARRSTSRPSWSPRCARAPRAGAPGCGSPRSACRAATTPSASSRSSPATTASSATTCWPRCSTASRRGCARSCCAPRSWTAICGDLADALTGQGSSSDILAELERTNGFVLGVDSRREWFRYHRLFAKLLRTRAERELGDELPRAARARGALVRRARHGLGGAAPRRRGAASGTSRSSSSPSTGSTSSCAARAARSAALVDALPAERLRADAELAAALACAAFEVGDAEAGRAHLEHAREAEAALPAARRRRYLETMALARLYRARLEGDFEAALEAADELLAEAAEHGGWSDDARQALVRAQLGRTALWAHRLDRARARSSSRRVSQARAAGLDYVDGLGAERARAARRDAARAGRRAGARREAVELAERARLGDDPRDRLRARRARDRRVLRPAPDERRASTWRARATRCSHGRTRHVEFMLDHLEARMAGAAGRPADGPARARRPTRSRTAAGTPSPYERAALASMRARLLARHGRPRRGRGGARARCATTPWLDVAGHRRAAASSPPATPDARARDRSAGARRRDRRAHRRRGRARRARGDRARRRRRARAAAARRSSARSSWPSATGHRWTFLEGGRRVEALLRAPDPHRHRAPRDRRRAAGARSRTATTSGGRSRRCWSRCSERECAILRYLPTTLSNREIAAELFVTTNTVKTHLRSIYRKLDVARRREAVERARDLRLLSTAGRR